MSEYTTEINKIKYQIKVVDSNEINKPQKDNDEDIVIGLSDCVNQVIYLDKNLTPDRMRQTLIHELAHAYMNEYYPTSWFDEEVLCNFVAIYAEDIIKVADKLCSDGLCADKTKEEYVCVDDYGREVCKLNVLKEVSL